jgi:hypothetical protein
MSRIISADLVGGQGVELPAQLEQDDGGDDQEPPRHLEGPRTSPRRKKAMKAAEMGSRVAVIIVRWTGCN